MIASGIAAGRYHNKFFLDGKFFSLWQTTNTMPNRIFLFERCLASLATVLMKLRYWLKFLCRWLIKFTKT